MMKDVIEKNIKKRYFYKQHEVLSYYDDLINDKNISGYTDIIIYTEEMENGKRCFILESFYSFLKYYCFYAMSLNEIYFVKNENINKENTINEQIQHDIDNKNSINGNPDMHLYELILTNEKRWLYFDIEYDIINNYENKESILFIFLIEFCLFIYSNFNIKICLNDILILDSSTNKKVSFHIIIKNIHTLNNDYYEYLIDYCNFYISQNEKEQKSGNPFYDKYKNKQYKRNHNKQNEKKQTEGTYSRI